jgi:threonine dehydrogenase-like Zn-dependent dehydrogenase
MEMTNGRRPDSCIDAVGAESHASGSTDVIPDKAKTAVGLATDRPQLFAKSMRAAERRARCRFRTSMSAIWTGFRWVRAMNNGLTFKMEQTHVQRYTAPLPGKIESGKIDPSFVITHKLPLEEAPQAYKMFRDKKVHCIKVVLKPRAGSQNGSSGDRVARAARPAQNSLQVESR